MQPFKKRLTTYFLLKLWGTTELHPYLGYFIITPYEKQPETVVIGCTFNFLLFCSNNALKSQFICVENQKNQETYAVYAVAFRYRLLKMSSYEVNQGKWQKTAKKGKKSCTLTHVMAHLCHQTWIHLLIPNFSDFPNI